jgi:hypothetical protein
MLGTNDDWDAATASNSNSYGFSWKLDKVRFAAASRAGRPGPEFHKTGQQRTLQRSQRRKSV